MKDSFFTDPEIELINEESRKIVKEEFDKKRSVKRKITSIEDESLVKMHTTLFPDIGQNFVQLSCGKIKHFVREPYFPDNHLFFIVGSIFTMELIAYLRNNLSFTLGDCFDEIQNIVENTTTDEIKTSDDVLMPFIIPIISDALAKQKDSFPLCLINADSVAQRIVPFSELMLKHLILLSKRSSSGKAKNCIVLKRFYMIVQKISEYVHSWLPPATNLLDYETQRSRIIFSIMGSTTDYTLEEKEYLPLEKFPLSVLLIPTVF